MATDTPLTIRIASNLHTLSPQLRKAAQYVAQHPDEVATRSLRYLASEIDVTPPTFSRMATALGFDDYESLRESCRVHLKAQRRRFSERADALQRSDLNQDKGKFIVRQGAAAIGNVEQLLKSINPDDLEHAANKLIKARRVVLIGAMSSKPFVDYLAYMASMAFDNWQVLGSGLRSAAAELVDVDDQDVAIVVSKAPYARSTIETAQTLRDKRCWTIGITDEVLSPLHASCSISFVVQTETPQFFSSHVATLVLIESLIGATVAKSGDHVSQRIAAIEAATHQNGEYYHQG